MISSDEIEWRCVVGREGKYEVSNLGTIRKSNGIPVGIFKGTGGYMRARLSQPRKIELVHRIVASAFHPNPNNLPCVNHIDFDPSNNRADNLEWCTQKQNLHHSHNAGRLRWDSNLGKRSFNAGISDEKANLIRDEYSKGGISWEKLGKKHSVSKRTVGRIVSNQTYV